MTSTDNVTVTNTDVQRDNSGYLKDKCTDLCRSQTLKYGMIFSLVFVFCLIMLVIDTRLASSNRKQKAKLQAVLKELEMGKKQADDEDDDEQQYDEDDDEQQFEIGDSESSRSNSAVVSRT